MKVAIYARLSGAKETQDNINDQLRRCREAPADRDWQVIGEYVDDGVSAYDLKARRPDWTRLLAEAPKAGAEVVVAREAERILRNPRDHADLIQSGMKVSPGDRGWKIIDPDSLEFDVHAMVGRQYARYVGARVKESHERRARAGTPPSGRSRTFGYTRTFEVVQDEAEILQEAAGRVVSGEPLKAITDDLAARGITGTRGAPITSTGLRRMLRNPVYAGYRKYQGEWVRGAWEPILDEDTFNRIIGHKAKPGPERKYEWPLRGLLWCTRCGGRMGGFPHQNRPGNVVRRYRCGECKQGIGAVKLEAMVRSRAIIPLLSRELRSAESLRKDRDAAATEASKVKTRLRELSQAYWVDEAMTRAEWEEARAALVPQLEDAKTRTRDAERALREAGSRDLGDTAEAVGERMNAMSSDELNATLRLVISRVNISPGRQGFDPERVEIVLKK